MDAVVYPRLREAGIPIHPVPFARGLAHPVAEARSMKRMLELVRRGRYDLLHAHSLKASLHARVAARVAGVPVVYTPHGFLVSGTFLSQTVGRHRKVIDRMLEKGLAPLTERVICVSESERARVLEQRIVSTERVHVVYNGCDPCDEEVEADATLTAMRAEGPLAAAVTVLREGKGVEVFLEAVPLVLERLPHARLAVVGNGRLKEALVAQARRLGLADDERFRFLPFVPPASRHLRALDVFVSPSLGEAGPPIALLEALACGIPQVATDVGGTQEAGVLETGLLVPPGDPDALASAVCALLEDPELRGRLARASRSRYRERFGAERMVDETARILHQVLRGRGSKVAPEFPAREDAGSQRA
jgi:glycosyltransferase involved in cell wall biosynthesis